MLLKTSSYVHALLWRQVDSTQFLIGKMSFEFEQIGSVPQQHGGGLCPTLTKGRADKPQGFKPQGLKMS